MQFAKLLCKLDKTLASLLEGGGKNRRFLSEGVALHHITPSVKLPKIGNLTAPSEREPRMMFPSYLPEK